MPDVAAFILAGGRSSRMGADKAFLEWRGKTLLENALAIARRVTKDVRIVGQREKFSGFGDVIEDVYAGQGPLAGIHAALNSSTADLNLVLAVDTPWITPKFLAYLIQQAELGNAVVTVPRVLGQLQPLCAVYKREFAAAAETALRNARNKIEPVIESVPHRVLEQSELTQLAFAVRMFDNLNTRDEWERARASRNNR